MTSLIVTDRPECSWCAGKEWNEDQGHFVCNPDRFFTRTTQGHRRTGRRPDCKNNTEEAPNGDPNVRQQLVNLLRGGS